MVILILYVDDCLLASNIERRIFGKFEDRIQSSYKTSHLFSLFRNKMNEDGSNQASQNTYTKKVLKHFGMSNCNPISTPMINEHIQSEKERKKVSTKDFYIGKLLVHLSIL